MKEKMKEMILKGNNNTKTKFYLDNKRDLTPGKRAKYMNECNRMEASTIFKARTRMLRVKCNYKKMFRDTEEENQEHILEFCTGLDRRETGIVTTEDIFQEKQKISRKQQGKS